MRILVFGASGFLGRSIARVIETSDNLLTVVGRKGGGLGTGQWPKARCVEIEYANDHELVAALSGHDIAINCIANVHGGDLSRESFKEVEVKLAGRIAAICSKHKVSLIQLSSTIAFGRNLPAAPVNESYAGHEFIMIDEVCLEREAAVTDAFSGGGEFAILRPAPVIGRGDKGSTPSKIFEAARTEGFPLVNGGCARVSFIDARDLGRAFLLAALRFQEIRGQTLIVGGFSASWSEIKGALDRTVGQTHQGLPLTADEAEKKFGKPAAEFLGANRLFDDAKFRAAVRYVPNFDLQASLANSLSRN